MKLHTIILGWMIFPSIGFASLKPDLVHVAENKKTEAYYRDGLIIGGDRAIDNVIVKDIRRAVNSGYERMVIDLVGNRNGEPAAIQRAPYFQISVTPDERRLVFTVWGRPKLGFNSQKVLSAFKKSALIQNVQLLPRVEEDAWTFAVNLKEDHPIEVFELSNPVRVIIDIQSNSRAQK